MSTRKRRIVVTVVAGLSLVGGTALATPGIGVISAPVHARGTNTEILNIHSDAGIKLKSKSPLDFATQRSRSRLAARQVGTAIRAPFS